ncbi:hypothetical protein [Streptomyces sp. SID3343]|uniref:DUF7683 domain-containing protein n=1 Tax=Streptomyces sp. SID3343 TaxID=2690260 RepID=UPI00136B92C6|nr:hypothetical protein [Streptomyces sp. SID3343]MYW04765.1 hypothetical protein [Streptomyces sp. SID3343]
MTWWLTGFSKETEELVEEVQVPGVTGRIVQNVLGLASDADVWTASFRVSGESLYRLASAIPHATSEAVDYFIEYLVTCLPIWELGTEPMFYWRDGVIVSTPQTGSAGERSSE